MKNFFLLSLFVLSQCFAQKNLKKYQTLRIDTVKVDIALPPEAVKIKGNLLILQGWNFSKEDWCLHSSLCKKALAEGYVLIMPEMGKSTYQSKNYPETRMDWRKYPTRKWISEKMIPFLQKNHELLLPEQANFMIGLSTGARGVLLITLDFPKLFSAVAALSGDYDQTLIPNDKVMQGFYGTYANFPIRWQQDDNVIFLAKQFQTPIYLGHGKNDRVIPWSQSKILYEHLQKISPNLDMIAIFPENSGHDYRYWDSEVLPVLNFFQKYQK